MEKLPDSWIEILEEFERGDFIEGMVVRHEPYSVFLDLNYEPVLGLIRIVSFRDEGRMTPELFPEIGTKVRGIITGFNEANLQVNLSIKPSDFMKFKKK